jgi:YNFM family putative membrane transporter
MQALRNRAVVAFLLFNVLAGAFFVGGALWVSFMRSFGTTPAQLGWILAAGWGASVLGALVGGHLTDSIGPRKMVLLTAVAVTVGLAGQAVARNWLQAGGSHLWVMAAQAAMLPASKALLQEAAGDDFGSALGFINTTFSAVAIPGAAVTGWVVARGGWVLLFAAKVATYLMALPILYLLLPEARGKTSRREERFGWREGLAQRPLLWVCSSVFAVMAGGYCRSFYPYFVQERFAVDVQGLALFDSMYNAVWMLSNWPAGLLADRIGSGGVAASGYALMGLSWFLFPLGPSLTAVYVAYALYCLGDSMGYYAGVLAQDVVAAAFKGRAMGLFDATMYLGGALGDGAGGWLWQTLGAHPSFALAATASAVAASLLFRAKRVGRSLLSHPSTAGPSSEEPSDA